MPSKLNYYSKKIFEKSITFEAWIGDTVTGLIAAYFTNVESQSAFITSVSVIKNQRGLGIASELLNNCVDYAQQNGFKEIHLEVNKENIPAINFYKKFNFIHLDFSEEKMIMKLEIN